MTEYLIHMHRKMQVIEVGGKLLKCQIYQNDRCSLLNDESEVKKAGIVSI